MFAHGGFQHILFNMIALIFIGPLLENFWGPQKFLTFYILTGIGAALIHTGIQFYQYNQLENRAESYLENPSPESFDSFVYSENKQIYFDAEMERFLDAYYENPDSQQYKQRSKQMVRDYYEVKIQRSPGMVGASGAIYGLLMALALLFPNLQLMLLFPPIPIKAKYLAIGLAAISIYLGINRQEGDVVAHMTHLGGMIVAFILIKIWQGRGTSYR
jgi:membrane associated rhomboid family serine protease